ncbi:MAG: prepilin-type N-terminal cleavage/methylation domain-containing protein [Gammaproteobacteria bacterium]|nr:prepilin-type N-terminal cleavage/methylation domain-containing protein [Gammaproteobacteria bacterium]
MNHYSGFTFLEILVSLFLLSIALFGLDVIHLRTLRDTQSAWYFSLATLQLNNLSEQLHAMHSESELAAIIQEWNMQNQNVLPKGRGSVVKNSATYQVTIAWGNDSAPCTHNHIDISGCLREDIPLAVHSLN